MKFGYHLSPAAKVLTLFMKYGRNDAFPSLYVWRVDILTRSNTVWESAQK